VPAVILAVEDTPHNLELMCYLLQAKGHQVVTATNGLAGVAAAREARPDLIVLDVQLPDIDGYQVLSLLRADAGIRDTPVIAVTAFAMVGDRDHALQAGFDGYLSKPLDPATFVGSIETFLPRHLHGIGAEPSWAGEAEPAASVASATADRRLLVGQISDVSLGVLRSALQPHGYALNVAPTALELRTVAERDQPHLIVVELDPPRGYGYNLVNLAAETGAALGVPVALVVPHDSRRPLPGVDLAVIHSPIDPERLLAQLSELLHNRSGAAL
jgi:two-component system cell cycle response regulator